MHITYSEDCNRRFWNSVCLADALGTVLSRYYFDFLHNDTLTRDDEGTEHPDEDAARREMTRALLEISRDAARAGEPWQIVGIVRDGRRDIWRGRVQFGAGAVSAELSQA